MVQSGIGCIKNKTNGKAYLFKSTNLAKRWENYHALLNANCHHNKELQKDWNELGSNNFIFEIKYITEDNSVSINEKFDYYKSLENSLYEEIKISDLSQIPFDYKRRILLEELNSIIGRDQPNSIFLNKLSLHNLDAGEYIDIKATVENLINTGEVRIGEVESKIDEIISQKIINQQNLLMERRKNLINELNSLIGSEIPNEYYKTLLEENHLSLDEGTQIKSQLENLINLDMVQSSLDEELNKLIESKVTENNLLLKSELLNELHEYTGQLDLSESYIAKLKEYNFSPEVGFVIRENVKKLIEEGKVRKGTVIEEIDKAIFDESERIANEKAENLINYLIGITGDTVISQQYKEKLDLFNLTEEMGIEIKQDLIKLITERQIQDTSEIDSRLDESIENYVINITREKEELIKQLHDITGKNPLSDSFKSKLKSCNTDESFGNELIIQLETKIASREIKGEFNFEGEIDNLIKTEKKNKLTNNIETEYFNKEEFKAKLNSNYLNAEIGGKIKDEFVSSLKDCKTIEELVDYENNLDSNIDKTIQRESQIKEGEVLNIRESLLAELYVQLNYLNEKVSSNEISLDDLEEIKETLEKTIKTEEITDKSFEYKIDELNDIKEKGIVGQIDKLVDELKEKENKLLEEAKERFKAKIDEIVKDDPESFTYKKLNENDLDNIYLVKIKNEFNSIVESDQILDSNFKTKIEEIDSYDENKIKDKTENLIKSYKENQDNNLSQLKSLTEGINAVSFKSKLNNNGLNDKIGKNIIETVENYIKKDTLNSTVEAELENQIKNFASEQNKSLEKLSEKVGDEYLNWKFIARIKIKNLNDEPHGYNIKNRLEEAIKNGVINTSNLDNAIDDEIKIEINNKNNKLKRELDQVMGVGNNINPTFSTRISNDNLSKADALQLKNDIIREIDANNLQKDDLEKVFNKKYAAKKEEVRVKLLTNKLYEFIGEDEPSSAFYHELTSHDLDENHWLIIKQKIIKDISKNNVDLSNIESVINNYVINLEIEDLKQILNELPNDKFEFLLKKFSISSIMPIKSNKINKLLEKNSIPNIKAELNKDYYPTRQFKHVTATKGKFCTSCGTKLDEDALFCTNCGNRME